MKWRLQPKRLKIPRRHAFGQGNMSYSSREAKYVSDGGLGIEVAIIGKTLKNVWRARVWPRKRELQPTGARNGLGGA